MMQGPLFELTDADRLNLAELVTSANWDLYTQKVFAPQCDYMREMCCTSMGDHRFVQGFYQGFCFARELAISMSKPKEQIAVPRIGTEADLFTRRR